VIVSGMWHSS